MPWKETDYLPSYEELTVPELTMTTPVMRAGALHFGKYCDNQCKEFMLCYQETLDPRKCLNEGKEVTRCGFEFFGKVKKHCADEFMKFHECIDFSSRDLIFKPCKKQQKIFDDCMQEKVGIERPPVGYFSLTRVHHTERPKHTLPEIPLPDPIPDPPSVEGRIPKHKHWPKHGLLS
ncbi:hypothetical protein ACJMK2_021252 [Sinanodonta woodiana]|uniref:IMS import disulfide relay-system CHCH-CHCH-like Cx9C domain-containing protein n=1 Tax=Sinanodonta woodiana TaxID=1069815 RepID=A0ABD3TFJ4_SINWO